MTIHIMPYIYAFIAIVATSILTQLAVAAGVAPPNSISMKVANHAGSPIELFWINNFGPKQDLVKQTQTPIRNASETSINSYDTHMFMVKFLDPKKAKYQATFTKGPREEIVNVYFNEKRKRLTIKQTTKYDDVLQTVRGLTKTCPKKTQDGFSDCVTKGTFDEYIKLSDSKSKLTKYRDLISSRLRNYTCEDPAMVTSPAERSYNFKHEGKNHKIDVLLDADASKIWIVNDFITEDECNHLVQVGRPLLRRATVASDDGSSIVSEHRKAQQTGYSLKPNDKLLPLYNRVIAITNHHAGYSLKREGQEEFTIIQYNKDDQYTSHCDGQCEGQKYNPGGRVATAVIYCKVPEVGGGTTFTRSDIFVKPTNGMATFFAYKGADGMMDDGYTEHSGCPVLEGEKWITTAWMREGVSAEDSWTQFDPSGVRLLSQDYYNANGKAHTLGDDNGQEEDEEGDDDEDVADYAEDEL